MADKWEYCILLIMEGEKVSQNEKEMNAMGVVGWELVTSYLQKGSNNVRLVFKRRKS